MEINGATHTLEELDSGVIVTGIAWTAIEWVSPIVGSMEKF
jgi:hypothetical protein